MPAWRLGRATRRSNSSHFEPNATAPPSAAVGAIQGVMIEGIGLLSRARSRALAFTLGT